MKDKELTPVRSQYLKIKRQYPDAILLFRLGDFYETFDEDARIVSEVCNIVLTSRPVGKGQRVPLAGVPHHSLETYLAKLIAAGYKVAICEQLSDKPIGGLVPREVVRVVTPGTIVEPGLLEDKRNNYLAAVVFEGKKAGLAYTDITTGEFAATQIEADDPLLALREELERLHPAEIIVDQASRKELENLGLSAHITSFESWHFELGNARQALLDHFEVATLDGFGLEGKSLAVRAAGAIIQYLSETQKTALRQLFSIKTYSTSEFMPLDPATRRNLELSETIRGREKKGSLLWVLDRTRTPMGGRLLYRWVHQPLVRTDEINRRLDAVEALFKDTILRAKVRELLKQVSDLERLVGRVRQGIANPRDLVGIRKTLEVARELRKTLEEKNPHPLQPVIQKLDPAPEVAHLIARAITDDPPATVGAGGVIRPGFSRELDGIIEASRNAKEWIAHLEARERQRTGIKNLKVGYNKVFGYYIEVTRSNLNAVPPDYIRKQTLVNAERFITPELKEYEALVLNAEERIAELEAQLFREVCREVALEGSRLLNTASALAELDVYASLAEVAERNGYVRPVIDESDEIHIIEGRHPVVELTIGEPFVPNDVHLTPEERILVITGPNMSGKSTYIRQVALIVLMAQIGSFVPAREARIGIVDRIFTRIGAQDEIAAGQSTFMVEMVETANILHHATSRSLLILDEIGRGTSTYDGISIAWAVVEYIHNHPKLRSRTLFATHYHELTELERFLPKVRNYNVAVAEEGGKVIFLHKIIPGGADRSYGIHVAQLAGLPKPVIHRAEEILRELESNSSPAAIRPRAPKATQLPLFTLSHPVLEELKNLDIDSMTPLEALNKLYELKRKVRGT
ncbi:MAG: DNA mismatch repair protein MutS [Anaerolineae bacterium]|nr:DNA mismatch repair protein MutS [Anaerolineae bacterium]MDW8101415.1 DNA mismatch repair protein MutS [Anaerolineae bacterium]